MAAERTSIQLPRELAQRILDRAANIDATDDRLELNSLRAAAMDAGISAESFDRALTEAVSVDRPPPPVPASVSPVATAATAAGIAAGSGTAALGVVSLMVGGAPPDTALIGAAVGVAGSIVGVVTYLLLKLRR